MQPSSSTDNSPLRPADGPELVIGLVGAIGTDLENVSSILRDELAKVRYETRLVRLSALLKQITAPEELRDAPADARYEDYMAAGTKFRMRMERADAVGLLAVSSIVRQREEVAKAGTIQYASRHAFILRSLKRPEEIRALRSIYGQSLYIFSVYSSKNKRVDALALEIMRSRHDSERSKYRGKAEQLAQIDEEELGTNFGQNVRDAFPLADFFVRADDRARLAEQIARCVEIIFEHPFHTPSPDELSMFMAKAAALRSADLSRQVGTVIVSGDGDLLATGCNEVPSAGGGLYWAGSRDHRDFQLGHDPSSVAKRDILSEVLDRLKKGGWLNPERSDAEIDALVDAALYGDDKDFFRGIRLLGLLEFGRIVHAEMAALMDAVRRGISVRAATMYTTTFPCHICARHIVASGIGRVVYVEPYPKSMAADLYPDSISLDSEPQGTRVVFDPFVGVAPRRFTELFEMPRRKDHRGVAVSWNPGVASPRIRRPEHSYLFVEKNVMKFLSEAIGKRGIGSGRKSGGENGGEGLAGGGASSGN